MEWNGKDRTGTEGTGKDGSEAEWIGMDRYPGTDALYFLSTGEVRQMRSRKMILDVAALEARLALGTTSPTIIVQPPAITGSIDTLTPPVPDQQLEYLGTVEAPVIVVLPTGTDQVNHFLVIVTARPFSPYGPLDSNSTATTVPIALATSPLTFTPVSQLA